MSMNENIQSARAHIIKMRTNLAIHDVIAVVEELIKEIEYLRHEVVRLEKAPVKTATKAPVKKPAAKKPATKVATKAASK